MTWKLSGECREGGKGTGWLSCEQTKKCARDERRSSGLGVIKFRLFTLPSLLSGKERVSSLGRRESAFSLGRRGVSSTTGKDSAVILHPAWHFS